MKTSTNSFKHRKKCHKLLILFYALVLISTVLYYLLIFVKERTWGRKVESVKRIHRNYFSGTEDMSNIGLIVNTSKCQIPDFDTWDEAIIPFINKAEPLKDCRRTSYNWTYVSGNELIVRKEVMKHDGYSFTNGTCCYKIIRRIVQNENHYDMKADNLVLYSSCIPITQVKTRILHEFIMVECSWIKIVGVAYRGFHGMAQKTNLEKIQFWKEKSTLKNNLPPNILVIGIDSTSRLNFRRNMFKTQRVLERLGSVEMFGYAKVGETTFFNYCAMFAGYSAEELKRICFFNSSTKLDDCPFIWKRLDEARYLTAHAEDAPAINGFNNGKTGFVHQPVDFYLRTLFNAAHDYGHIVPLIRKYQMDCIGYETNDEIIANYMESTIDFSVKENAPIFAFSWSTTLSHGNINGIQLCDETYANLLNRLDRKGHLDNTILIFMGDHGSRYGPLRETLPGYYEDKLPNMWIRLPPTVRNKFPHWQTNLLKNQRLLASHYTLHWTLNKILDAYTLTKTMEDSFDFATKEVIPKKYKQTFFDPIPAENTCEDVGVPEQCCTCNRLQKVELNDSNLIQAARMATQKINSKLTNNSECSQLKVSTVSAGAVMNKTSVKLRYVVGFVTEPGAFFFEAEMDFYPMSNSYSSSINVQRASKINQEDVKCIKDTKLQLFCFCVS